MAGRGAAFSFTSLRTPGRQAPLPLPPWVRSYEQWKQDSDEEEADEHVKGKSSRDTPRSKASKTAKPRVPLFAWERLTAEPGQEHLLDEASRAERIERAFRSAKHKTVLMRTWIILLFVLYNLYSFYLAAGDIHNTIVIFYPRLATMGEPRQPEQLVAGAFTYTSSSTRDKFIECFLEMFVSMLTKLIIWLTIVPFMIICMHWKAEPRLHLEDLMPDSRDWPTVDIFLPRYKEAWESFEPTIRATLASPESEPPTEPPSTLESSHASPAQLPLSPRGSARTPNGRVRFSFTAPRCMSPRPSKRGSGSDGTSGSVPSPATQAKPTPRKYILPSLGPRNSVKVQLPATSFSPFSSPMVQGLMGQPSPRRPIGPPTPSRFSLQSAPATQSEPPGREPSSRHSSGQNSSPQNTNDGSLHTRRSLQGPDGPLKARKPPPLQIEGGRRGSTVSTSTRIDEDKVSSGGAGAQTVPSQSQPSMPDYPALDYPPSKLNIYICDDGARDPNTSIENQVKKLVASLPPGMPMVHYITRSNALHAKAGNLNSALQHADGDLLAVFDSDHIASPAFLLDMVPHMLCQKRQGDVEKGKTAAGSWTLEGSRVGMVQSKQYFYNENEFVPYICGADNKIYYYLLQHGLNGLGAANCVGTGYVMNRKALDEVGGYVGGWAVEDSFTSTAIFGSGWVTKYIPDCEAIGLAPPTLSEHVQQRWRWSIGSVQLLLYGNYSRNLSFMRTLGVVVGNWYPIALSAVFIAIIARLTCFVAYVFLATPQRTTATQVAISWLGFAVIIALPNVGIVGKIFDIIGLFILQSVHLTVTGYALIGRLNPAKKKVPKIKAASEAQGDFRLPPMIIWMTVLVVIIILAALLIQLLAPENANLELGMALTVSVLFMLVLVAAPVCLVVLYVFFQTLKHFIRRKLRRSKAREESPYPPVYFSKTKRGQTDDLMSKVGK